MSSFRSNINLQAGSLSIFPLTFLLGGRQARISKQVTQMETLQTTLAKAQNKEIEQAASLHQADTVMAELKKQCQQLQAQYRETIMTKVVKRKQTAIISKKPSKNIKKVIYE